MKTLFGKLLLGGALFVFAVYQPMHANLIASVATKSGLDLTGQAHLLNQAHLLDPCNSDILNTLGDTYLRGKNFLLAGVAYGKAIPCSPGRAELRFKFGEMLLAQGYLHGIANVKEALLLEPNNPYYKSEFERLTKFQLP